MAHTFLFEEGTWRVEGEHRDAAGAVSPVSGENTIRHEPGRWHFEAALRLRGDPLRVTHNRYQIEPFSPGAASTHWSSNNPVLGALRGRFVVTRRRDPFLVREPDRALPRLRVHPAARRAALQRARRDARGGQADLDLGAGAHAD